jgi:hypothetical protein
MKSINSDAWLVNFILSQKLIFFKLMWHTWPQQCVHLLDSTQPKRAHPNHISSKKLQLGPTKSFSGYMNNASLHEQFWAHPSYKRAKFAMMHMICHNLHATSDYI